MLAIAFITALFRYLALSARDATWAEHGARKNIELT
jgi:hypothetical protein